MELPHPQQAAREAGLRYVTDAQPGFRRRRRGKRFEYLRPEGRPLRDAPHLQRIAALAIPPAWNNVWICPLSNGHLQATGFDARGRKQYRYHAQWTHARNHGKFGEMAAFGEALPSIRRRIARDLTQPGLPRSKVLACVAWLLDQHMLRVGNDEYARDNSSYGLTTIRSRHVRVSRGGAWFRFAAKSGRRVEVRIANARIVRVIRGCLELPGQQLFEYIDDRGGSRDVGSGDVNDYFFEITGQRFTAKDFRTWGGTVVAAETLNGLGPPSAGVNGQPLPQRELKRREVQAVRAAAEALGNTVATCRKFYVHPRLAEAYAQSLLDACFAQAQRSRKPANLGVSERAVLRLAKALASSEAAGPHALRTRKSRTTLSLLRDSLAMPRAAGNGTANESARRPRRRAAA